MSRKRKIREILPCTHSNNVAFISDIYLLLIIDMLRIPRNTEPDVLVISDYAGTTNSALPYALTRVSR